MAWIPDKVRPQARYDIPIIVKILIAENRLTNNRLPRVIREEAVSIIKNRFRNLKTVARSVNITAMACSALSHSRDEDGHLNGFLL